MQTFKPGDTKKALTITLIHHEGYTQEKDFYVLLKNPVGKAELGEPNLARITIIDDDGNDLDLCEKYIVDRAANNGWSLDIDRPKFANVCCG